LFAALQASACPQLLRVWNYLPRINDTSSGLERYRQFNAGRQRAFIDAGFDAFQGSPAACALGSAGSAGTGLSIRFLAARTMPVPLENPRQVPAWSYSPTYGARSPTFSRAALAEAGDGRVLLLVSGTASIVGEDSVHPGDVPAQLAETLTNLRSVIDVARSRCTADFSLATLICTVYLRDPRDLAVVRAGLAAAQRQDSPAVADAIYVHADICRSELLLEIEGHAILPGKLL
jgi:hypothetical protein